MQSVEMGIGGGVLHPLRRLFTQGPAPSSITAGTGGELEGDMRLAAYLRVSTERQAEDDRYGVDRQRHDVEEFVRRATDEHEVVVEYVEKTSGTNGIELRELFPEMLGCLEAGEIDGVVLPDLTRLSRSLTTQEALLAAIWSRGGVVFTSDGFEVPEDDPEDPMRTAMRQMAGVFAQLDRAMIAKRLRDGRKAKARRLAEAGKKYAWSHAPYGYVKDPDTGQLLPDEGSEAEQTINDIVTLKGSGWTMRGIAHKLNEDGRATPSGRGTWSATQVMRILQREQEFEELHT